MNLGFLSAAVMAEIEHPVKPEAVQQLSFADLTISLAHLPNRF